MAFFRFAEGGLILLGQSESCGRADLGDRAQTIGAHLDHDEATKLRHEDLLLLDVGSLRHLALVVGMRDLVSHQTALASNNTLVAHQKYSRLKDREAKLHPAGISVKGKAGIHF